MKLVDYPAIPSHVVTDLKNYVERHKCPSVWVYAILTNNLIDTIKNPEQHSILVLLEIIRWLSNEIPENIWGSIENVEAYLEG